MCRGKRADPVGIGGNVWSGETGLRNLRTDGLVERGPLRQKSSGIVVLRAHCSPTAEAVRLITDLERQQIGAERARYIGRLGGCIFGRPAREIEPVDELPNARMNAASRSMLAGQIAKASGAIGSAFQTVRSLVLPPMRITPSGPSSRTSPRMEALSGVK